MFPRCVEITPATVNDVEVGRQTELEAGATYVFDKGYYHFGWWKKISAANAFFVTRVKVDIALAQDEVCGTCARPSATVLKSSTTPTSCSRARAIQLPIPLRRIKVKRDKRRDDPLITNDLKRTAVEIAALYKSRWQIELAVPLDQAASQSSQVHGQERQRHSSANHCCDDRLSAPASRAAAQFLENAGPAPRRTRLPTLVHAKIDRRNRHPATSQSELATKAQLLLLISWGSTMCDFSRDSPALAEQLLQHLHRRLLWMERPLLAQSGRSYANGISWSITNE